MENKKETFDRLLGACEGKVRPAVIADLMSVSEFKEELSKFEGELNIQSLYELAEKVRIEFFNKMKDEQFKQEYISEHGVEAWQNWKYRYRFLANGRRRVKKILETERS